MWIETQSWLRMAPFIGEGRAPEINCLDQRAQSGQSAGPALETRSEELGHQCTGPRTSA